MNAESIIQTVRKREELAFSDIKVSYLILKPNVAKHYKEMTRQIKENNFYIVAQYAIFDYHTLNMALHQNQATAMKYIIPISRFYNDFYSNYAILIVVGKTNITYNNLCIQVVGLKQMLRSRYNLPYVSYALNTSLIGQKNEHQQILIKDSNGKDVPKDRFNEEGTYMLFFTNEVHSPDKEIESMVTEMELLYTMNILNDEGLLPKSILHNISRYQTFAFLKDLI